MKGFTGIYRIVKMFIIPTSERVFTLRKSIEENGKLIAYGFDRMNGIFLQIFENEESGSQIPLSYDQSVAMTGMFFSTPISRDVLRDVLAAKYPNSYEKVTSFLKEELSFPHYGHATDEKGRYEKKVEMITYGDWLDFFDTVDKHYIITDMFDQLIARR